MDADAVLLILIAVLLFGSAVELLARFLQVCHQPAQPPAEVAGFVEVGEYQKAQAYARERFKLAASSEVVTLAVWIAAITTGALAGLYGWVEGWMGGSWLTPIAFLALMALLIDVLSLPFSLRSTFGIEAKYGFNRTTPATFFRDKVMSYALLALFGGGLLALLFWSIDAWGSWFWVPYALVISVVMVLLAAFQTTVLLPLFNKLTPLPAGDLRDAIEAYARAQGVELAGIFQMDGSRRSSKANAFFSGLGKQKRVVLYDTLIEQHPIDEVVAVLAHEVGHDRHGHLPKVLLGNVASITLTLFVASWVIDSAVLSQALGAPERVVALNLIVFTLLFGPINLAIGVLFNALSRRFEYQADAFAVRTSSRAGLANAMRRFVKNNLSMTTAHPLYAVLNLTHPAPVDRIRAIERRA
jgi:STE24 endopeptidase